MFTVTSHTSLLVRCMLLGSVRKLVTEQSSERFSQIAMDAFVVDVDPGEDGLVEQATDLLATGNVDCPDVRTVAVHGVVEGTHHGKLELLELHGGGSQTFGDFSEAAGNAVLFSLEQIERYSLGVVGL
ncbi:hypothetical protein [Mycobacteroides abscessus]|uniref:hypothetical protein n=1 Tax=Mycobacteroides abscessus TaxID=36809 RepID=UPI0013000DD0|nr:hypothetical protein [Mycobacteroides abscessus]